MDANGVGLAEPPEINVEEKEKQIKYLYKAIPTQWKHLCRPGSPLLATVKNVVANLGQMQAEASMLMIMHLERMIREGKNIPVIDQTFIDWSFAHVSVCSVRMTAKKETKNQCDVFELKNTADEYHKIRNESSDVPPLASRDHLTKTRSTLGREMLTNMQNHVMLNLFRWTRAHFSHILPILVEKDVDKDTRSNFNRWATDCTKALFYGIKVGNEIPKRKSTKTKQQPAKKRARKNPGPSTPPKKEDGFTKEEREIMENYVEKCRPFLNNWVPAQSKRKWYCGLRWLYYMQSYIDSHPNTKRLRSFSILPTFQSLTPFITLNDYCLKEIASLAGIRGVSIEEIWAKHIDLTKTRKGRKRASSFVPAGWQFCRIKTDGCSASVICEKPKPENWVDPEDRPKWRAPTDKTRNLPVIGIDPGRIDILTGGYEVPNGQKNARIQYSLKEYRVKAQMSRIEKKRKRLETELIGENFYTQHTLRTTDPEEIRTYIRVFLSGLSKRMKYANDRRVLKLRFHRKLMQTRALDDICGRFLGHKKEAKVIALGAAGFDSCSRGHPPGPSKSVRDRLKTRVAELQKHNEPVYLHEIDEFRTSVLCSGCHCPLTGVKNKWQVKRCENQNCSHGYWNRDTNAFRNMITLFKNERDNIPRPIPFCRSPATE